MNAEWSTPRYLKGIVVKWFDRSEKRKAWPSIFDRFIFLWIAFDAWGSNESHLINENMINWVKTSPMKDVFKKIRKEIDPYLKQLSVKGEIPNHISDNTIRLHDPHDFHKLIEVIYQIRNNLFHGHKLPDDKDDEEFVTLAYNILSPLLQPFVDELKKRHFA